MEYVVCPLCGLNRVLYKHGKGRARWDAVDPETALVLQVRRGGGYGSGFYLDGERSLTLGQMCRIEAYRPVLVAMAKQVRRIGTLLDGLFLSAEDVPGTGARPSRPNES